MNILYIYRSLDAGPSIRRVFEPIEKKMSETNNVENLFLPSPNAGLKDIMKNIIYVKKHVKNKKYDIIHITGDVHYLAWILPKDKTVVTVHDLVFYVSQKKSLKTLAFWFIWILPLKFCSFVTFISQKSFLEAQDIIRLDKNRTCVIHNPYGEHFVFHKKEINTSFPEILHIGTKSNKNLERVAMSLQGLACKLHIIGKLSVEQEQILKENHIQFYSEYGVSDNHIVESYINCDIVSFPSLYEGFGMPIIEGQAIGRPVVTSNLSPMKEVANGSAVLVNPDDALSIHNGFIEAINNSSKYIEMGRNNVSRFSLDSIVDNYLSVYSKLV